MNKYSDTVHSEKERETKKQILKWQPNTINHCYKAQQL